MGNTWCFCLATQRCVECGLATCCARPGQPNPTLIPYPVGCAAAFAGAAEELDVTALEAGPQLAAAECAAAELVSKASPRPLLAAHTTHS